MRKGVFIQRGSLLTTQEIWVAAFFSRDDLEVFFFDDCFVINYFSFAVVGIPNFSRQFEYMSAGMFQ